jgi:calcineurin-like phosphoesterase family protein
VIFFTSDQHFGHQNVIQYCSRPYSDVYAMLEDFVSRYNRTVGPDDVCFHLGDFSLHPRELSVLKYLNGTKHFIAGNHDHCHPMHCKSEEKLKRKRDLYLEAGFKSVAESDSLMLTEIPFSTVLLHHMPYQGDHENIEERYPEWRLPDEGRWLLHGHVHTLWRVRGRMINVGVDQWDYAPVSWDRIKEIMRGIDEAAKNS